MNAADVPYYIESPPAVIPVNLGRQLFVDDFLIDSMAGLTRTYHQAEVIGGPLTEPGEDEVSFFTRASGVTLETYFAAPFSDGVWWDAYRRRYRAWLLSGKAAVRLAESEDGVEWYRAALGNGNEVVMEVPMGRDSGCVWIDYETEDDSARYKMAHFNFQDKRNWVYASEDGLNWPAYWDPAARTAHYSSRPETPTGDRTTFFRDPFRKKWVWSLRDLADLRQIGGREYNRVRRFAEADNLIDDFNAPQGNTPWLIANPADALGDWAQLYNLDGIAYESLMLFLLSIYTNDGQTDMDAGASIAKPNQLHLGFSRDGFHMSRPERDRHTPFLGVGEPESWNEGNVQSVGGGITIDGPPEREHLNIYFSARENKVAAPDRLVRWGRMGLARVRRDGFASIDADSEGGILETRPIRFDHDDGYLFVNAAVSNGELRVEVVDDAGAVVPGLAFQDCTPVAADATRIGIRWASRGSLSALSRQPFRLRFSIQSGSLFSFWVAPTLEGTSNGFLAAGGPGYHGYVDNVTRSSTGTNPDPEIPTPFALISNAPNPFSSATRIRYRLIWAGDVDIGIFDVLGRRVATLVEGQRAEGLHEVWFDGSSLPTGPYFCRMTSEGREDTLKIMIQR
jgi:hypothetical protein